MLRKSIILQLQKLSERYSDITRLLGDQHIIDDQEKYHKLSKEYASIRTLVEHYTAYQALENEINQTKELMNDPELALLAKTELSQLQNNIKVLSETILKALTPKDPNDACDIYLEVRAGTGGEEAALFAHDLAKMYQNYIQRRGWRHSINSLTEATHGGYKEIIIQVQGNDVFGSLKYESGGHRVQRIPTTESQGRVHTSACTVAILPVLDEIEDIDIQTTDLKIDTYRSSGAGGQHVNTTDSAIRITHIPTGIVVECQEERSQHKNKAKALAHLKAKILDSKRQEQASTQAAARKSLVGSGDRSERIRTYNFPQGRVTDHRINLTLYQLDSIIMGDIEPLISALKQQDEADKLNELENQ
ncbi:MAG: peptide chain release factor 1 [Legionellales bacterium]|nr:peptide chain release factor 1 [Legionellales bacterium]|tara:strand:+ start:22 stop:1104 length:1083 start_codon:yes stop_codon:yes gene_type:complete